MTINKYERTYASATAAEKATRHLDEVLDFLRQQTAPLSCKEIGKGIWGDLYVQNGKYLRSGKQVQAAELGQVLRHLRKGGYLKVEEIKGEPVEIKVEEWVSKTPDGKPIPEFITVHDDEGNKYEMRNPNYKPSWGYHREGSWEMVTKTIIPRVKVFSLVEG